MIVMLCRNGLAYSRRCLESLLTQEGSPPILVVDNASTDGTTAWLTAEQQRTWPQVRVFGMTFAETVSVAEAWNRALGWSWGRLGLAEGEVLVVNNDTELLPQTHRMLCEYLYRAESVGRPVGMVTCIGREPKYMEQAVCQARVGCQDWSWNERPHPDFSCFLLARWAFEQVGKFDEGFEGAYYEDNDYHVRMHRAGVKAVCIDLPFLHHARGVMKGAGQLERKRIAEAADKNKRRFWEKYGCWPGTKGYERLFE